jgi:hypothetical protein
VVQRVKGSARAGFRAGDVSKPGLPPVPSLFGERGMGPRTVGLSPSLPVFPTFLRVLLLRAVGKVCLFETECDPFRHVKAALDARVEPGFGMPANGKVSPDKRRSG